MAHTGTITITAASLGSPAADVTDFVYKLFMSNLNAKSSAFFNLLRSDGMDLRVSLDNYSTYCDKDMVGFSKTGPTGYIAIRIPTLSHTNNLVLYLSCDGTTSYANATGTYRTAYKMVIPANEASGNLVDRTQYANNMVPTGTPTYQQSGLYGLGAKLANTTDHFDAANSASLSALTTKTIRLWCKPSANQTSGKDGIARWHASGQTEWTFDSAFNDAYNKDTVNGGYKLDYQGTAVYLTSAIHQSILRVANTGITSSMWRDGAPLSLTHTSGGSFTAVQNTTSPTVLGYEAYNFVAALVGVYNHIEILNEQISDSDATADYNQMTASNTIGTGSSWVTAAAGSRLVGDSALVGNSVLVGHSALVL